VLVLCLRLSRSPPTSTAKGVGDSVTAVLATPEEAQALGIPVPIPSGPRITMRIVGVVDLRSSPTGRPLAARGAHRPPYPPSAITALRQVQPFPMDLAAFLTVLAVGAVGHALASAVRRRRYDLAVLRPIAMTSRVVKVPGRRPCRRWRLLSCPEALGSSPSGRNSLLPHQHLHEIARSGAGEAPATAALLPIACHQACRHLCPLSWHGRRCGRRGRCAGREGSQCVRGHRSGEEVSLPLLAAELCEVPALVVCFDAFGYDRQSEAVRHRNHGRTMGASPAVGIACTNDRSIFSVLTGRLASRDMEENPVPKSSMARPTPISSSDRS